MLRIKKVLVWGQECGTDSELLGDFFWWFFVVLDDSDDSDSEVY
jgi:hypothetical protein